MNLAEVTVPSHNVSDAFESLPMACIRCDSEALIRTLNPQAQTLFGWTETEARGRRFPDLFATESNRGALEALLSDKGQRATVLLASKTGALLTCDCFASPEKGSDGHICSWLVLAQDIGERVAFQSRLHAAKENAETANQEKREFVASMSHEIRTSLTTIMGFSELLRDMAILPESAKYLNGIIGAGRSVLSLIDDVSDLMRMELGKVELSLEPVSLAAICTELAANFPSERNSVYLELDHSLPDYVVLDPARVRQILAYLLVQSFRLGASGRTELLCKAVRTGSETYDLEFVISNRELVVSEDKIKKLFVPFAGPGKDSDVEIDGQRGSGIGLSITRNLAHIMGGEIVAESGPGLRFVFTLPGTRSAKSPESAVFEGAGYVGSLNFEGKLLLHAEDDELNRIVMRGFLSDLNLRIIEAGNGQETLAKVAEQKPDIIIMDLQMPVLSGFEAVRRLKADPATSSIPIIAISATVMGVEHEEIRSLCAAYISKPVLRSQLISVLSDALLGKPYSPSTSLKLKGLWPAQVQALSSLKAEFASMFRSLENGIVITDEAASFSLRLAGIVTKNSLGGVVAFSSQLNAAVETFDFAAIGKLLKEFSDAIAQTLML